MNRPHLSLHTLCLVALIVSVPALATDDQQPTVAARHHRRLRHHPAPAQCLSGP